MRSTQVAPHVAELEWDRIAFSKEWEGEISGAGVTSILVLLASMFVPLAILLAVMLGVDRLRARDQRRSPLSDRIFHQPGEGLRKRIASLTDNIEEKILRTLFIGPLLLLAILLPRVNWSKMSFGWAEACICLVAAIFVA